MVRCVQRGSVRGREDRPLGADGHDGLSIRSQTQQVGARRGEAVGPDLAIRAREDVPVGAHAEEAGTRPGDALHRDDEAQVVALPVHSVLAAKHRRGHEPGAADDEFRSVPGHRSSMSIVSKGLRAQVAPSELARIVPTSPTATNRDPLHAMSRRDWSVPEDRAAQDEPSTLVRIVPERPHGGKNGPVPGQTVERRGRAGRARRPEDAVRAREGRSPRADRDEQLPVPRHVQRSARVSGKRGVHADPSGLVRTTPEPPTATKTPPP